LVFLRYASLWLRRVSSMYASTSAGRCFTIPCLAQKSLRFFSAPNMVMLETKNLQRAMIGSFLSFGYDSFEPHKEIVDCFYKCSSQSMFQLLRLFAARSSQATRLSYFIHEGLSSTFLKFFRASCCRSVRQRMLYYTNMLKMSTSF